MKEQNLIALEEICIYHKIEAAFIHSLQETGLVKVITVNDAMFIENEELLSLEKYIDFHYNLGINLEGIETISHLLKRLESLQEEVAQLKNQLSFHHFVS